MNYSLAWKKIIDLMPLALFKILQIFEKAA